MRKIASVLALAAAAVGTQLVLAAPSHADTQAGVTAANLHITAAAGKTNSITIDPADGDVIVRDGGDVIRPAPGCLRVSADSVRCSGVQVIQITLGDGDDSVVNNTGIGARVKGGDGADTMTAGSGGDTFTGGPGDDTFTGGAGTDNMVADATADGADVFNGGGNVDTVVYNDRLATVFVSLDGQANDGAARERDNVGTDVENIRGGKGADTITGDDDANEIRAGAGVDTVDARGGKDVVNGDAGADTLNGGAGDDTVRGLDGAAGDTVNGGANTDTCTVDAGDTEIDCEN
ncbi:Ca2+-binding RTX toxin-like protein [Thermocatellispora tengchongensis]|uniref:Ca2+-binding RTX toxin-like protein n=1 Tax=Thermocatellispora tengchongensis TaxID=1073253 RepID=A0A840P602_9ACTN|nr:calcium-binding protein [Thermocatellispora tengchongensis]MBB5135098.1 Ca2+-binding RTX toxin-like protein [Thermocatellispora tengchongensis]